MTSRIVPADIDPGGRFFEVTVPGNEKWTVLAVCATVTRGAVVDAGRGYLLQIAASGFALGAVGAVDPGSGPGTCVVTWADAPASAAAFGNDGFVVAPFASTRLDPGYLLVGSITHSHGGDFFDVVTCWIDYVPS